MGRCLECHTDGCARSRTPCSCVCHRDYGRKQKDPGKKEQGSGARQNVEVERRFLVDSSLFLRDHPGAVRTEIVQGYLSTSPCVRIRVYDDPPTRAEVTVKGEGAVSRAEFNLRVYDLDLKSACELVRSELCSARIRKVRHEATVGKTRWEVDRFVDGLDGLWMAEVELESEDSPFDRPRWLGREVTDDPRYSNVALATAGRAPEEPRRDEREFPEIDTR